MKIGGLQKLTLLDYPNKVACTVFTVGCNFRCPFCHNGGMVLGTSCEEMSEAEVLDFLRKRKNVLEGVCLTGGEPLIQLGVAEFLQKVKSLGYSVKLDTNGSSPEILQKLAREKLIDYVAMDVKNSIAAYPQTAGARVDMSAICKSVNFLKSDAIDYEFRTTVTGNFHTEQTIAEMGKWLQGAKKLYLQKFVASEHLLDKDTFGCDDATLVRYRKILQPYFNEVTIRGADIAEADA